MAKKKELDNLSKDMIRCKKDGFGCHYGHWKALHPYTKDMVEPAIPENWLICQECGKPFKPKTKRSQFYCEPACQRAAATRKFKEKNKDYYKIATHKYRERKAEHG